MLPTYRLHISSACTACALSETCRATFRDAYRSAPLAISAQDVIFTPDEMLALEKENDLPNGHTRSCSRPPPPPSPPPRAPPAMCEVPSPSTPPLAPAQLCYDPPLIEHHYFDEQYLITQGPASQVVSECSPWCIAQIEADCEARVAFQVGETFGCGFDPGVSRCSLFAASPLVTLNVTGLWAVTMQCKGRRLSKACVRPWWLTWLCSLAACLPIPATNRWNGRRQLGGAAVRQDQPDA